MRKTFFKELEKQMYRNDNIYSLTGDLGYIGFDNIKKAFPDRFLNCGASEQAMLDIAVGLAYSDKLPVVYSITPFLIYRGFETIKLYIDHEKLPVVLIGSGRDKDYKSDGPSHDATDIPAVLGVLQNLKTYFPESSEEIPELLDKVFKDQLSTFISLKR